jgi:CHAT domain-containing protein
MGIAGMIAAIALWIVAIPPEGAEGWILRNRGGAELVLDRAGAQAPALSPGERGVIITADPSGRETWRELGDPPVDGAGENPASKGRESPREFGAPTRGPEGSAESMGAGPLATTVVLDQLAARPLFRAGLRPLLAPQGAVLGPSVTLRRPGADSPKLELTLSREGQPIAKIALPEGSDARPLGDLPGCPAEFRAGLPPGEYELSAGGMPESNRFTVEDPAVAEAIRRPYRALGEALGGADHPLAARAEAEALLAMTDEEGKPIPYGADALDALERVPGPSRSPAWERMRSGILAQLRGDGGAPAGAEADPDATGIAPIDEAREEIGLGHWDRALAALDKVSPADGGRGAALRGLYRGVILAESAPALADEADAAFARSVADSEGLPAADRERIRLGAAGYWLGRARDSLHNAPLRLAASAPAPLASGLESAWRAGQALEGIPGPLAAVARAQRETLLGDYARTLGDGEAGRELAAAAEASARRLAESALGESAGTPTAGAADEILAHLDYRAGRFAEARAHAESALKDATERGRLVAAEPSLRLLGLIAMREGKPAEAERHLLAAQGIAEALRDRLPPNQAGRSQAGFLARRAAVSGLLVELALARGDAAEALARAEAGKARALEDVLRARAAEPADPGLAPEIPALLAEWPEGVAALEYSLGAERCHAFLVTTAGEVRAFPLHRDGTAEPLDPRELVARIRRILGNIEGTAAKMRQGILAGRGFDNRWEADLAALRRELIPDQILGELARARTVVIVPQHVLHYVPFAALVTKRDPAGDGSDRVPRPQFLIDSGFDLAVNPSLAAWSRLRSRERRPLGQAGALAIRALPGCAELPGVERDAAGLAAAFKDRVSGVARERDADEAAALALLDRPGLALLATHGVNIADRPLESHLLFFPDRDGKGDGRLSAADIYGSHVQSDIVVLSACYSGLADRSPLPGDDLFGIQRALLHSGARSVISGLWDVYDETGPELVSGLLQGLAAGQPAPTALASSQRAFLAKLRRSGDAAEPWLHPYFWAVYAASGDDRAP